MKAVAEPERSTGGRAVGTAARVASAGLWLVVHQTYALELERERLLDAVELQALDRRISPHGLIVPAIAPDGDAP